MVRRLERAIVMVGVYHHVGGEPRQAALRHRPVSGVLRPAPPGRQVEVSASFRRNGVYLLQAGLRVPREEAEAEPIVTDNQQPGSSKEA